MVTDFLDVLLMEKIVTTEPIRLPYLIGLREVDTYVFLEPKRRDYKYPKLFPKFLSPFEVNSKKYAWPVPSPFDNSDVTHCVQHSR